MVTRCKIDRSPVGAPGEEGQAGGQRAGLTRDSDPGWRGGPEDHPSRGTGTRGQCCEASFLLAQHCRTG